MSLEATVGGDAAQKFVTMRNTGSTAIYYEWRRSQTGAGLGASWVVDAAGQFFAPAAKGCILPDTEARVHFCFKPRKAGIFEERWSLQMTPASAQPVADVTLRGVALDAPERGHAVRTLLGELEARRVANMVRGILQRDVVDQVFRRTIPTPSASTPSSAPTTPAPAAAPAPTEAEAAAEAAAAPATPRTRPPRDVRRAAGHRGGARAAEESAIAADASRPPRRPPPPPRRPPPTATRPRRPPRMATPSRSARCRPRRRRRRPRPTPTPTRAVRARGAATPTNSRRG